MTLMEMAEKVGEELDRKGKGFALYDLAYEDVFIAFRVAAEEAVKELQFLRENSCLDPRLLPGIDFAVTAIQIKFELLPDKPDARE